MGRSTDWMLAIAGGSLLAVLIDCNGLLAKHSTPFLASWVAHGIGSVAALPLVACSRRDRSVRRITIPLWAYSGGMLGALALILSALTVNSSLALSGTIAFNLSGQVIFGILSDHFGLFGVPQRRVTLTDYGVVLAVLTGSWLLIFF
jgi:bacterial/archaeal transporter family-2 protein